MAERRNIALLRLLFFLLMVFPILQRAAARAQSFPEAAVYVDRAVIAYAEKRYDDALKELEEALRLDPNSVDALYYRGLVYLALNRPQDAQPALEAARRLRPRDDDIAFHLAILYFNQKNYEKAEPLFRQAYQADRQRQNIGYYLGVIEYRKRNYREALNIFRAAVPSDENFAQLIRFYAALATGALGFPREAHAEIQEALRTQPLSPLSAPAQKFGELLRRAEEKERFFFGELKLGVFYDTNVPVVPHASSDLVAQAIRGNQTRRKSEGELASVNAAYRWLRKLDWEGTASYRFLHTYNNHLTKFNIQSHTPNLNLMKRGLMPGALGGLPYVVGSHATYDFITLGNARFMQRGILSPYVGLQGNAWNLTTLQFRFQWKDFFNDRDVARREVRDAKNYMVGPQHVMIFDEGRLSFKLGYQYDADFAEGENWSYRGHRLQAGGQYLLPWGEVRFRYDLDFHWRFHENRHSLLPVTEPGTRKRRDREAVHLFAVAKDLNWAGRNFTIAAEYLFDRNKSNLRSFDYSRHVVMASLTWRF